MTHLDKNHRVVNVKGQYRPEYQPLLFRTKLLRWVNGWTEYRAWEIIVDRNGEEHKVSTEIRFDEESEALEWLSNNKIGK